MRAGVAVGLPSVSEAVAVAVHLQDMDMVGEAVQQRSGEPFRADHVGPFVEGQFRSGGGQGHEAQFVDDQQAEAG